MKLLLLVTVLSTTILAEESAEFHSKKVENNWVSAVYEDISKFNATNRSNRNAHFTGRFWTRIDHFSPPNQERVAFVYHVNVNYFSEPSGPLYIYLKDAHESMSTQWIERELMVDTAAISNAALLTFDHRFFGMNRPTSNTSFDNLRLFTIEQALADISTFIRFVRTVVGLNTYSRVVLWGSGMGGTLAVYARKRYPHLVAGAWSSSGIFQLDVYGYGPFDYLEDTISQYTNFECTGRIQSAFTEMQQLIANDKGYVLQEKLNLCQSVVTDSSLDTAALWEGTVRMIMRYIEEYHLNGVNALCRDMNAVSDAFDAFARWLRYVYGDKVCFDHSYKNIVARNSNPEWDHDGTKVGTRQSLYLQCIQVGLFPVADSFTWLNGTLPLDYHFQKCADVLGPQYSYFDIVGNKPVSLELFYEFEIVDMPNIVYTGGSIDPWRYFGRWISYLNPVYMIHYHSKSADLPSIHYSDPEDLYNVKHVIRDLVLLWSEI